MLLNDDLNGKSSRNLIPVDTDNSGSVVTTTLYYTADSASYDYIVRNDVSTTLPLSPIPVRVVNGIGVGANASIINDYYVEYNVISGCYSNKSVFSVYCHPNVNNMTIFDAYGKGAERSMAINTSISIDLSGASISLSPSSSWTINETHVQHIR